MKEGSNIHRDSNGKVLCSYSKKLCLQRRMENYGFCIKHILEDPSAPFRQCQYFTTKHPSKQCTNPVKDDSSENQKYCAAHRQILGLMPRKIPLKRVKKQPDDSTPNNKPVKGGQKRKTPPNADIQKTEATVDTWSDSDSDTCIYNFYEQVESSFNQEQTSTEEVTQDDLLKRRKSRLLRLKALYYKSSQDLEEKVKRKNRANFLVQQRLKVEEELNQARLKKLQAGSTKKKTSSDRNRAPSRQGHGPSQTQGGGRSRPSTNNNNNNVHGPKKNVLVGHLQAPQQQKYSLQVEGEVLDDEIGEDEYEEVEVVEVEVEEDEDNNNVHTIHNNNNHVHHHLHDGHSMGRNDDNNTMARLHQFQGQQMVHGTHNNTLDSSLAASALLSQGLNMGLSVGGMAPMNLSTGKFNLAAAANSLPPELAANLLLHPVKEDLKGKKKNPRAPPRKKLKKAPSPPQQQGLTATTTSTPPAPFYNHANFVASHLNPNLNPNLNQNNPIRSPLPRAGSQHPLPDSAMFTSHIDSGAQAQIVSEYSIADMQDQIEALVLDDRIGDLVLKIQSLRKSFLSNMPTSTFPYSNPMTPIGHGLPTNQINTPLNPATYHSLSQGLPQGLSPGMTPSLPPGVHTFTHKNVV
eukprot:TRINITY_DN10930_c0_g1_i1.p1 TRINITY_DN10930_c0_g1~~TRINITY_DN10930_c0_g1_i1.p1  ORF type:complete len:632 (+),score=122.47 TRINITY_DN10930_c0_g1_i1:135-2030(+)